MSMPAPVPLTPAVTLQLPAPTRQVRLAPYSYAAGQPQGILVVHSGCAEDDPYHRMFFLPTDTLKITAFDPAGRQLWSRDLGPGVIPGVWFCPVLAFDLDGDGADEVWVVANGDADHPLDFESYRLERMDAATGRVTMRWPWPLPARPQDMSGLYRNFLQGAEENGHRRLITAQGTYGPMALQSYDAQMRLLWERHIPGDGRGARGSHMFPVVDIDGDGVDELFWGERCIDVRTGEDRWVADGDTWNGHSDVIQPTLDRAAGRWWLYTCREAGRPNGAAVLYDDAGRRRWGLFDIGHMDMGWTARLNDDGSHQAMAIEIGSKQAGPGGFVRGGVVEYRFDVRTGARLPVEFPLYMTLPVDFDGDGLHELVYAGGEHEGLVIDRHGKPLAQIEGSAYCGARLLDLPGEQIATWSPDGRVRIYACPTAVHSEAARARYSHPYYGACTRALTVGYNRTNLGGL